MKSITLGAADGELLVTPLQAILLALAVTISVLTFKTTLLSCHIICMCLGFLLLMGRGLLRALDFRPAEGAERVRGIETHAFTQIGALLLAGLGFAAIVASKMLRGKGHFHSTHAKLGLATMILSATSIVLGAVSFRKLGIIQRFPEQWQPGIKKLHRLLGTVTWFTALLTIEWVLPHKALYKVGLTQLWQVGVGLAGACMLVLLLKPPAQRLPRTAAPELIKGGGARVGSI